MKPTKQEISKELRELCTAIMHSKDGIALEKFLKRKIAAIGGKNYYKLVMKYFDIITNMIGEDYIFYNSESEVPTFVTFYVTNQKADPKMVEEIGQDKDFIFLDPKGNLEYHSYIET